MVTAFKFLLEVVISGRLCTAVWNQNPQLIPINTFVCRLFPLSLSPRPWIRGCQDLIQVVRNKSFKHNADVILWQAFIEKLKTIEY